MRFAIPLSLMAAGLVASAAAQTADAADKTKDAATAKPAHACFLPRDVRGWKSVGIDRDRMNFRVNASDIYTAGVLGVCPNLDFAQSIGLSTYVSSFICEGDDAKLFVRGETRPDRCDLQKFHKLSKDEVAALSKDEKP